MYEIGVIGPLEKILYFMAAGFKIYPCTDAHSSQEAFRMAKNDSCAIIFVIPETAENISKSISAYSSFTFPAVITLPQKGEGGGISQLKAAVERAVGADIIFKDN